MNSSQLASRRTVPRAERLDRDRQAAPQVFERLRSLIISLDLPPGAPLSRATLAAQFGVSATPVRDALMRLEDEGLVEVFPQHATVVSRIDIFLAQQAHFLRQALELELVRTLALDHSDELVADLTRTIMQQQQFSADGDFKQFMAEDNRFHHQLYVAAGRQGLWELVRSRSGHIDRLRRLHLPSPGKAEAIMADHRAIVDAIAASNPDAAQDKTRYHLAGTVSNAVEISKMFPHYITSD
jgi:DNA-binding GntR family transcriptional regulator